jgi:hypothetical protein
VAKQKDWKGQRRTVDTATDARQQVIHFPFSRHSSYEELRHLVSVFRPKDVYACTVDPVSWTEEFSMKSLFGDLCAGDDFYHDSIVREEVAVLRIEQAVKDRKRKRAQDSQQDDQSSQLSPSFFSARMEASRVTVGSSSQRGRVPAQAVTQKNPRTRSSQSEVEARAPSNLDGRVSLIKEEFLKLNNGSEIVVLDGIDESQGEAQEPNAESQASLGVSAFDSQEHTLKFGEALRPDTASARAGSSRASNRKEAYRAARRSMKTGDNREWDDMGLQSVGGRAEGDGELEL